MHAPQIIWIVIAAVALLFAARDHGKTTRRNFWAQLIGAALGVGLLLWGGFFSH